MVSIGYYPCPVGATSLSHTIQTHIRMHDILILPLFSSQYPSSWSEIIAVSIFPHWNYENSGITQIHTCFNCIFFHEDQNPPLRSNSRILNIPKSPMVPQSLGWPGNPQCQPHTGSRDSFVGIVPDPNIKIRIGGNPGSSVA